MTNDLIPSNFNRALAQVQAKRKISAAQATVAPAPSKSPRARLNIFPDNTTIADMVDKALAALSRGVVWARGAIVNLVV